MNSPKFPSASVVRLDQAHNVSKSCTHECCRKQDIRQMDLGLALTCSWPFLPCLQSKSRVLRNSHRWVKSSNPHLASRKVRASPVSCYLEVGRGIARSMVSTPLLPKRHWEILSEGAANPKGHRFKELQLYNCISHFTYFLKSP